jgi:hypothetical protein
LLRRFHGISAEARAQRLGWKEISGARRRARAVGVARGGVDCSSGDEGYLFVAALTVAKIRRANVGPDKQGFIDALNARMLPLTQDG